MMILLNKTSCVIDKPLLEQRTVKQMQRFFINLKNKQHFLTFRIIYSRNVLTSIVFIVRKLNMRTIQTIKNAVYPAKALAI